MSNKLLISVTSNPITGNPITGNVDRATQQIPYRRERSFKVAHSLLVSFKYAWAGLSYTFMTQRNFRIHTAIGTFALSLGAVLHLPLMELSVIGLTAGFVMVMELLNTALEAIVDLTVGQTYHELAKIGKDCAAGAVLIAAIVAVLVAGLLLLPPLLATLV